jgi:hypothetical protein
LIAVADSFEHRLHRYAEEEAQTKAFQSMKMEWGPRLDPQLKKPLSDAVEEIFSQLEFSAAVVKRMVGPNELEAGMQLLQDLYSGTDVLLLKKGTVFDEAGIDSIKRCFMIDPFEAKIAVLVERSED